jgi:CheY-like chemotaxis protein
MRPSAKTIMVVEDDASIGMFLVQAIDEETPHRAFLVTDALQALKALKEIHPDLLLLDYQLPYMDGFTLYDRINSQEERTVIPAVMMSANLPQHEIERRHLIGLKKPFELDDLLTTIEHLLPSD